MRGFKNMQNINLCDKGYSYIYYVPKEQMYENLMFLIRWRWRWWWSQINRTLYQQNYLDRGHFVIRTYNKSS
jgi:hypothetical protein